MFCFHVKKNAQKHNNLYIRVYFENEIIMTDNFLILWIRI